MKAILLESQVTLPLSQPPRLDGNNLSNFRPAVATKVGAGDYLIAFTDAELAATFARKNPTYSYCLRARADWVIAIASPKHGILFNPGADHQLELSDQKVASLSSKRHSDDKANLTQ